MTNGQQQRGRGVERISRLTPLQDGMFFDALRKQGSGEVTCQVYLELRGNIQPEVMRESWRHVVDRHPIMRTSFHYERLDAPVQVAHYDVEVPWRELDWRDRTEQRRDRDLEALMAADRQAPFSLTMAPLMRLTYIAATDGFSWLVWTFHHLLFDGWSAYMVLDDVTHCYRELIQGHQVQLPPTRPYWEYVAWLQERQGERAELYWRRQLAGVRGPTPLGYENVSGVPADADFGEAVEMLDPEVESALTRFVRGRRITSATLVQAAWAITLSRYCGSDDVVFGSVVSGRTPEFSGIDKMVGLFINVLPIRLRVDDVRMVDWLTDVQRQLADARQHEHTSLTDTQRWSEVPRGVPLFESLVAFVNYPIREGWTDGGPLQVTGQRMVQPPHYPLHLTVVTGAQGWRLILAYDPRRFRRSTTRRLVRLVAEILSAIAHDPDAQIGELPRWAGTPPLAELVVEPNADRADPSWLELLRAVAAQRPAAVAMTSEEASLTYHELIARSARLAARLRAAGAGPSVPVRTDVDDLAGFVVVVAAAQAGAPVRLTTRSAGDSAELVCLVDADAPDGITVLPTGATAGGTPASGDVAPGLLVGSPVGELWLNQRALGALCRWRQITLPLLSGDRLTTNCASFPAVRDRLWALAAGATVVFGPAEANSATCATLSVSEAVALATGPMPSALRRIVVSGGPLPQAMRTPLRRRGLQLVEEYPHPDGTAAVTLIDAAQVEPRTSPLVGRRHRAARTFPLPGGPPVQPGDERMWAVMALLSQHPGIRDAHAAALDVRDRAAMIVAWVVPADGAPAPEQAELKQLISTRLGAELAPQRVVVLRALPIDKSGQVRMDALPGWAKAAAPSAAPLDDPLVELVAQIWSRVLDVPLAEVGVATGFFDLGGHSLVAIRLVSRIQSTFGVEFTLNDLFAEPTVDGCARTVRAALAEGAVAEEDTAIPRVDRTGSLPMSSGQQRLWLMDKIEPAANNLLLPSLVPREIDADRFGAAVLAVLERHEVLRTCLDAENGHPVQRIMAVPARPPLVVDDLAHLDRDVAERQARSLLGADAARRFDLATEPPVRFRLIRLARGLSVIGVCVHHIAFDGWSTGVLFGDLSAAYLALTDAHSPAQQPLPAQYADYAVWQRERLSGGRLDRLLTFWRDELAGAPDTMELTETRPIGVEPGAATHGVDLPPSVVDALNRLTIEEHCTQSTAMLSVWATVLARRAGSSEVVVGTQVAGRDHPDLARLVGFFVNTLVLRVKLGDRPTFRELLRQVRNTSLRAFTHADLPFERLVAHLRPDRVRDRFPLAQFGFTFQNVPFRPLEFDGCVAEYFPVRHDVARFDLTGEFIPWQGGIRCALRYATNRYPAGLIRQLAAELVDVTRNLVEQPDAPIDSDTSEAEADLAGLSRRMLAAATDSRGE